MLGQKTWATLKFQPRPAPTSEILLPAQLEVTYRMLTIFLETYKNTGFYEEPPKQLTAVVKKTTKNDMI